LFACDRIPPHAIGATTGDLLRRAGEPHLVGVANAVVRKLAGIVNDERTGDGPLGRLQAAAWPADRALRYGLPQLLIDDLAPVVPEDAEAALAALTRLPPLCTRQRPGKPIYAGKGVVRQDGPWTWWDDPHEALHGPVADGLVVVQDRAQGRAIELARARPLERVVDLCAAPGGKSLSLHDIGCQVTACDLPGRIDELRANLPLEIPVVACDARKTTFADGEFDLVVLDAPCSNSGVLARRPEAMARYDRKHLDSLGRLQRELLSAATRLVKPDGRLLYATCSLSPRENQQVTHHLAGWRILAEHLAWPDAWQAGGYAALLVRT
jgi:16S rRNA (cytosine967-C5)-methyltransferase